MLGGALTGCKITRDRRSNCRYYCPDFELYVIVKYGGSHDPSPRLVRIRPAARLGLRHDRKAVFAGARCVSHRGFHLVQRIRARAGGRTARVPLGRQGLLLHELWRCAHAGDTLDPTAYGNSLQILEPRGAARRGSARPHSNRTNRGLFSICQTRRLQQRRRFLVRGASKRNVVCDHGGQASCSGIRPRHGNYATRRNSRWGDGLGKALGTPAPRGGGLNDYRHGVNADDCGSI